MMKFAAGLIAVTLSAWVQTQAYAGDSHAEFYYPAPATKEVYVSPVETLPSANKRTRIGFTSGIRSQQLKRAYAPGYHIFAKGTEAQKLIIVSTGAERYNTLYRLRALLAALSSEARLSPMFQETENAVELNFFDLARLIGFEQITVSDGDKLAHRINLR